MKGKLNELALFAGAGGGILGGILCGFQTVCAVEWDAYARDILVARQNDGCLETFPIWDDVQTFDGRPWRGIVDVVSGGFPCQDISAAGKGAGIEGERSGMWRHMARIIGEVLPRFVIVENSPMLVGRGLGMVLGDLAEMGYDAQWGIVGAHHAGAPHKRDRIWVLADTTRLHDRSGNAGTPQRQVSESGKSGGANDVADTIKQQRDGWMHRPSWWIREPLEALQDARRRGREEDGVSIPESLMGRVAHGVAARVDRLRCIGNGQVPAVVPIAWNILSE